MTKGAVHLLVATRLLGPEALEELRALVPAEVTLNHIVVPWSDGSNAPAMTPEWTAALATAHVVVGFPQQFPELARLAPNLCWVQNYGAGYELAPLDEMRAAGIGFVSAAGANADGVAEFALMAVLCLGRRVPERLAAQQQHQWARFPTSALRGRRLTVVGAGEIGSRLCTMAEALGLVVTCVRQRPELGPPPGASRVVGADQLVEVMPATDVLVLASALTAETEQAGKAAFTAAPPGLLVVNVGRGGLLDHAALLEALATGQVGGAWLDVLPAEPMPPEHPLWSAPGVIISSHDATATADYQANVARLTARNIGLWLAGQPVPHTVLPLRPAPASTPS